MSGSVIGRTAANAAERVLTTPPDASPRSGAPN